MQTVALFYHMPECSTDSCMGIIKALSEQYRIKVLDETFDAVSLEGVDLFVFPGGFGHQDNFDDLFANKAHIVKNYVAQGGHYLGICMGAYWAGKSFFDLLTHDVDEAQYRYQPGTTVRHGRDCVIPIDWLGQTHNMYFHDGTTFTGDPAHFQTVATYENGDPAAIIQNRVGLIGVHPESLEYWYSKSKTKNYWHHNTHHQLLRNFVDMLMQR